MANVVQTFAMWVQEHAQEKCRDCGFDVSNGSGVVADFVRESAASFPRSAEKTANARFFQERLPQGKILFEKAWKSYSRCGRRDGSCCSLVVPNVTIGNSFQTHTCEWSRERWLYNREVAQVEQIKEACDRLRRLKMSEPNGWTMGKRYTQDFDNNCFFFWSSYGEVVFSGYSYSGRELCIAVSAAKDLLRKFGLLASQAYQGVLAGSPCLSIQKAILDWKAPPESSLLYEQLEVEGKSMLANQ